MNAYETLVKELREIALLGSISSLLHWDEQTHLPTKGAEHRADQASMIAVMSHQRFTSPKIGELLHEAAAATPSPGTPGEGRGEGRTSNDSDVQVNVREWKRKYDRATKLPESLVEELSKTGVLAQHAWIEARKESSYQKFKPWLAKIVDLKRQEAKCYTGGSVTYDALLEDYEPHETTENLNRVFASLRDPLIELVARIKDSGKQSPVHLLERKFPAAAQEKLAAEAAKAIGFDFDSGRMDISVHPFCTELGPNDVRITTRYDENYFSDAFFGTLHETGHALYEQGLPAAHWGTPLGESISLGIHESQSRLWENFVGRSRAFWEFFMPKAKTAFPEVLRDVSLDDWFFAINDVRPSFIRTEADEATYNLHVLLRFEMEQAILAGDVSLDDIPAAWNEKMKKYLGITPPDDAKGCLQDIHWSGGGFGYFTTYTLGNLYAAQFMEQARQDLGDLDGQFARGEFAPLLNWLRRNIHQHGKRYTAVHLLQYTTGHSLTADALLRHLKERAQNLYFSNK